MDILVVSHEGFASGMKQAAEMIVGELPNVTVIELTASGVEEYAEKVTDFLSKRQNECLVLADLLGGTPSNQVILQTKRLNKEEQIKIVANITLGLLLEASFLQHTQGIDELLLRTQSQVVELAMTVSQEDE